GVHHVQILIRQPLCKHRAEGGGRAVALQVADVFQVAGAVLGQVGVDVLGGLLPADAKGTHQVVGRESALPQTDDFDQAVSQQQVPAGGPALGRSVQCCHGVVLQSA